MCCGVETNGWYLYRQSQWYQQFGSQVDRPVTYQGNIESQTLNLWLALCLSRCTSMTVLIILLSYYNARPVLVIAESILLPPESIVLKITECMLM